MEGSTSPCCGAGYPGTTYGFPSPDAPRTRMPDTRANTVGERCKYTGESKVKSKSKKVTYTRNPKNPFGGVTVEESLYRCNCEVKCEDYDLGVVDSWLGAPVLGWMRDSSGDFTDYEEIEGGDYGLIVYASYDDFKKAWDELEAMNRNLSPSISVPNDPDHSSIGLYDKDWMQDFIDRMRESCPNNKAYDDYIQDLVNDLTSECEKYCNDNKGKKVD